MQPKQSKALLAVVVYTGDEGVLAGTDLLHDRQVQDGFNLGRGVVVKVKVEFAFVVSEHD